MKKYLIALSLVGLVTSSCYEKLNIAPPNAITDEQVKELLATADDETIEVMARISECCPCVASKVMISCSDNKRPQAGLAATSML